MEWVETTGKTVEEAKELALDQLGVDENEAEFELLEEPKTGLFGRTRGAARVRARILPRAPRAKTERRRRPKKDSSDAPPRGGRGDGGRGDGGRRGGEARAAASNGAEKTQKADTAPAADEGDAVATAPKAGGGRRGGGREGGASQERSKEPMDQAEQIDVLEEFLTGLAGGFGLTVTATSTFDEDDLRVDLRGEGLGLLVGPRLATLDAIQEIARNTLQRQAAGREYARVVVDVEGIRERRRAALTEFVTAAAERVKDEQTEVVFEVMSSADRKQVHDVAGDLDGVVSASEGEDPRRRVVLRSA
jgi:spoIIIJ-associated protein